MNPTVKTLGLTAALGLVLTAGAAADGGAKGMAPGAISPS